MAEPPAVVAPAPADKPAPDVVLARDVRSEVLASLDTPLPLAKAGRTEQAVLRQAVFLSGALTVVRPAAGGEDRLRWSYEPYVQRQLCFTSITGQFSCAAADVEALAEKASGEAPLPPGGDGSALRPEADAAHAALATALRARAPALFQADRRLRIDPMLKAAGVVVRAAATSARDGALRR